MSDYESRYYETLSELDTATSELAEYKKAEVQLRKDLADVKARLTSAEESFAQSEEAIAIGTFVAQLAEREAEIVNLRRVLNYYANGNPALGTLNEAAKALSTPQSTAYLKQWEKEHYQVVARVSIDNDAKLTSDLIDCELPSGTTLYARKEK